MMQDNSILSRGEVAEPLETRAADLDQAASVTTSKFLRAIYQAQSEALRTAAASFNEPHPASR